MGRGTYAAAPWLILLLMVSPSIAAEPPAPRIANASIGSGSLMLEFDEPMLAWAGDGPLSAISVEPPLRCNWYWSNDTQLLCDVGDRMEEIRPATRYRVSINAGLWSQRNAEIGKQTVLLESERPKIEATIVDWHDGRPTIAVTTNVAVTAEALRIALLATLEDGSQTSFELQRQSTPEIHEPHTSHEWRMTFTGSVGDRVVAVSAVPGLQTHEGELRGEQQERLLHARLDEAFRLRLVSCNRTSATSWAPEAAQPSAGADAPIAIHCPAGEQIELELSDALSPHSIELLRSRLPDGLRIESTDATLFHRFGNQSQADLRPGYFVRIASDRPNQSLELVVPSEMMAARGAPLDRAVRITIDSTDYLPGIDMMPARLLLPPGARAPAILSAMNQPALHIEQSELGKGALKSREATLAPTPLNVATRLAPPDPTSEVRTRGGLISGLLRQRDRTPNFAPSANYTVAYASFNISASTAKNQVLVWLTNWDDASGIARAEVELLQTVAASEMKILATATTDADGIASFDLPRAQDSRSRGKLLLRASHHGRRAILPLSGGLKDEREDRGYRYGVLQEGEQITWGVTDRPLYRPGDVVHYRLWLRERQRNHLRVIDDLHSAEFVLDGQKVINRFKASLDAYGSASGELHLPSLLSDGDYCIRTATHDPDYASPGACFRVAGYHVNDIWAALSADRNIARDGDIVALDASAGYYSGGPAAGAMAEFQSLLTPMRIEETYPRFDEFTFVDPFVDTAGSGGEHFSGQIPPVVATDAQGHARIKVALSNPQQTTGDDRKPIPFGKLEFSVSISGSPGNGAYSAPATLQFSRHARFVGMKTRDWVLRNDTDPIVETIVLTADGESVTDMPVTVRIDEVHARSDAAATPLEPLARCDVPPGRPMNCPFRAPHPGVFRFTASSDGAVPTSFVRYAFGDKASTPDDDEHRTQLLLIGTHRADNRLARLNLQQPYREASVLFAIEHGDVLKHWVQKIETHATNIEIPIEPSWTPGVTIRATVLDATGSPFDRNSETEGTLTTTTSIDLVVDANKREPAIALTVDRAQAAPGQSIAITLRNNMNERRQVTLSVVDDAARALAPELAIAADPQGSQWLGRLSSWDTPRWYSLGDWERGIGASRGHTQPVFDLASNDESLDTITVTGSSINAADVFSRGEANDHTLGIPELPSALAADGLRGRFAESAFWTTDIELEPGAIRSVNVRLPDNLTRWRVLAWSTDNADGFALAQETIEASLPIEVRTDIPTRLFPGDATTLSASVRNHADTASLIDATLRATGNGINAEVPMRSVIAAHAEAQMSIDARPQEAGGITLEIRATSEHARDGVAGVVEVASPIIRTRLPVAGWLPSDGVNLRLPALPPGATHPLIRVEAGHSLLAFASDWAQALRDYPHRCWEQVLSRAIGAAASKQLGIAIGDRDDAAMAVNEAIEGASRFQDSNGQMHFFVSEGGDPASAPSLYLTAYTVRAFAFLTSLGYVIPSDVDRRARQALLESLTTNMTQTGKDSTARGDLADAAAALAPTTPVPSPMLDSLWDSRDELGWSGRASLALALAASDRSGDRMRQLLDQLRGAGGKHGLHRTIVTDPIKRRPLTSPVFDQCRLIDALTQVDHSVDAPQIRLEYLRGLTDLYAGGVLTADTHTGAQCLMTLANTPEATSGRLPSRIGLIAGSTSGLIDIGTTAATGTWTGHFAALPATLNLTPQEQQEVLLSFVATVEYEMDGRKSAPAATAFRLDRTYSVLRAHAWQHVESTSIREGDWVRVTLRIANNDIRRFVAITDSVPGGLRPANIELAGVTGLDLREAGDRGSVYFPARQIDDRLARFYAEQLPPGTQEVHYFARATHRGDYAALPATAELMYSRAGAAHTNSTTLHIH